MAKRDQGEPTMPLSPSQFLPPKPPPPQISKNDASVWRGLVVGADDFAPTAAKPNKLIKRWMIFGGIGAFVATIGIYAFYPSSDQPPAEAERPAPVVAPPVVATPAPIKPAVAATPVAPPVEAVPPKPQQVDAITPADPPIPKPAKIVKKKPPAKKPTTAIKRKK